MNTKPKQIWMIFNTRVETALQANLSKFSNNTFSTFSLWLTCFSIKPKQFCFKIQSNCTNGHHNTMAKQTVHTFTIIWTSQQRSFSSVFKTAGLGRFDCNPRRYCQSFQYLYWPTWCKLSSSVSVLPHYMNQYLTCTDLQCRHTWLQFPLFHLVSHNPSRRMCAHHLIKYDQRHNCTRTNQ